MIILVYCYLQILKNYLELERFIKKMAKVWFLFRRIYKDRKPKPNYFKKPNEEGLYDSNR